MLPRLRAEQLLVDVHATMLGSGNMKAADVRQEMTQIRAAAGAAAAPRKPLARANFAALGIGYVPVPAIPHAR
jgi:hypothetical protein